MKQVIYYEACDGKRFDCEEDCLSYENGLKSYLILDSLGRETDLLCSTYIVVFTTYGAKAVHDLCLSSNTFSPWEGHCCKPGVWYWDDNTDERNKWVEVFGGISGFLAVADKIKEKGKEERG